VKPETYIGHGSIEYLSAALLKYAVGSILLVTGKSSFSLSGAEAVIAPMLSPYQVHRFSDFSNNPNIRDLQKGVESFRVYRPGLILAVGGGSVIDMAKLISVFATEEGDVEDYVLKHKEWKHRGQPLVAIPTTAGTGSEATQFATLYVDKRKYSVSDETLLPDVAIIDPLMTRNLPPYLTATSGMDALSQAIESYWSVYSTDQSKSYAREAIHIIANQLSRAVNRPTDDSRLYMARASHLAGKAINITKTTAPHALSYPLTSKFGVPHGQAVSLTLSGFIKYNYGVTKADLADRRGISYVRKTMEEISRYLGCESVRDSSIRVEEIMKDIGLATTFTDLGIDRHEAIECVINEVNIERLVNNPRRVSQAQMRELLQSIE
jgi:alcohol dehydrogenase class IV